MKAEQEEIGSLFTEGKRKSRGGAVTVTELCYDQTSSCRVFSTDGLGCKSAFYRPSWFLFRLRSHTFWQCKPNSSPLLQGTHCVGHESHRVSTRDELPPSHPLRLVTGPSLIINKSYHLLSACSEPSMVPTCLTAIITYKHSPNSYFHTGKLRLKKVKWPHTASEGLK